MEFNAITTKGYFNASPLVLEKIDYLDSTCCFDVDVTDSKDGIIALIDIPSSATGNHKLEILGVNGFCDKTIALTSGKLNVIHLTTYGYMRENGKASFNFVSGKGAINELNIKIGFIKHVNVVNN